MMQEKADETEVMILAAQAAIRAAVEVAGAVMSEVTLIMAIISLVKTSENRDKRADVALGRYLLLEAVSLVGETTAHEIVRQAGAVVRNQSKGVPS